MQGIPVILKLHHLQSLYKVLDLSIEFRICESDFYFLNGGIKCMVATYNFGSVYIGSSIVMQFHQTLKH